MNVVVKIQVYSLSSIYFVISRKNSHECKLIPNEFHVKNF